MLKGLLVKSVVKAAPLPISYYQTQETPMIAR